MLSIVIPSHNRPDLLQLCLDSVARHAPPDTQIIVVDDGSREACVSDVARRFGVQVVRHEKPKGFALAANAGIAVAIGDVIELLNDDAEVTAGWADRVAEWFADPAVAAVAPLVLQGPPHGGTPIIDSAGDDYDRGGFARKRGHGRPLSDEHRVAGDVFGASASSAFYRADALRRVGGFPADFGSYFEDVDLSWRLFNAGWRTRYQPESVVWHRVGASHRRRRRLSEQQSRNEERVFWRNVPDKRGALPRHAAVLLGKALRRLREGSLTPWLFGRLRAWSELALRVVFRPTA